MKNTKLEFRGTKIVPRESMGENWPIGPGPCSSQQAPKQAVLF